MKMSTLITPANSTGPNDPAPTFSSLAFGQIGRPDYAQVMLVPIPPGSRLTAREWAIEIFRIRELPVPIRLLFSARQQLVRLLGMKPAAADIFDVSLTSGCEALINASERHLDFGAAVAVENGLLRVTTVVKLHGWRGRLYFAPVRLVHPLITEAMMRSAVRRVHQRQGR